MNNFWLTVVNSFKKIISLFKNKKQIKKTEFF